MYQNHNYSIKREKTRIENAERIAKAEGFVLIHKVGTLIAIYRGCKCKSHKDEGFLEREDKGVL